MSAPKIITNYWAKTIPDRQFDWSAWRDGDEPRAAPGPDGAWGKLSVKLTAGLTRINPGALCGQVAGAWRFEKPGFWLMAFRETWTPAAGRALVWHPLYSRHTPNQRAPFDRGNCGLSPPTGPPTAPRQPRPNPKPAPRATAATAAVPPRHIWGAAGSATRPSLPRQAGQ